MHKKFLQIMSGIIIGIISICDSHPARAMNPYEQCKWKPHVWAGEQPGTGIKRCWWCGILHPKGEKHIRENEIKKERGWENEQKEEEKRKRERERQQQEEEYRRRERERQQQEEEYRRRERERQQQQEELRRERERLQVIRLNRVNEAKKDVNPDPEPQYMEMLKQMKIKRSIITTLDPLSDL